MDLPYIFSIILLALGFGFVIFWHELGHFLAAKWAGVKVEQFAVGFGTAALAWRKGIGWRVGTTRPEYEKRAREYLLQHEGGKLSNAELADATTDEKRIDVAAGALGLGETEYRLNWLPLGGYVKMLGQDDLDPTKVVNDPRAYNTQTIAKRMVIVSAGVVMNIILAAILFFVLFLYGFDAPPAIVGSIQPMSPAQKAGLQVGDEIKTLNGGIQHDFTKIVLNVALSDENETVPMEVRRAGTDTIETLQVRPERARGDTRGILMLGVGSSSELRGPDPKRLDEDTRFNPQFDSPSLNQLRPDEIITRIGDVAVTDYTSQHYLLDRALQASGGRPVEIEVKATDGSTRVEQVQPRFAGAFDDDEKNPTNFAGMVPRTTVLKLTPDSVVIGKVKPDDVIVSVHVVGLNDRTDHPSRAKLMEILNRAGQGGKKVILTVLRGGEVVQLDEVEPSFKTEAGTRGIGVLLSTDAEHAVVGSVLEKSPARAAGIPQGSTIVAVNGQPVQSWYDVHGVLERGKPNEPFLISAKPPDQEKPAEYKLSLDATDIERLASFRYVSPLMLRERSIPRRTTNPVTAAAWGVGETRDLIAQFYLTLKRMFQGSVPASNLMGPVGIAQAGARLADRGTDWLIWFLAQISANLAVVNFLPIPIVDGGLFVFLIVEKLKGRPLSPRTQSIFQVIGLALIISVFVFVTYQDIMR